MSKLNQLGKRHLYFLVALAVPFMLYWVLKARRSWSPQTIRLEGLGTRTYDLKYPASDLLLSISKGDKENDATYIRWWNPQSGQLLRTLKLPRREPLNPYLNQRNHKYSSNFEDFAQLTPDTKRIIYAYGVNGHTQYSVS